MYTYDFFWYSGARNPDVYAAGDAILLDVYEDPLDPDNVVSFRFRNVIDNGYDSSSIVNVFFDTGTADTLASPMFTDLSIAEQSTGVSLTEPGDYSVDDPFLNFQKIAFSADYSAGRESMSLPKTLGVNPGEYLVVKGTLGDGWQFADLIAALNVGMNDAYNDALYWDELPTTEKTEYRELASSGLRISVLLHSLVPNTVNPDGHGLFVLDGLVGISEPPTPGPDGNVERGTDGGDTLIGSSGADTMLGLAGNDTYNVDHAGDVVVEQAEQGVDTVRAFVSFVLPANVENLAILATGTISGTGNELDNLIVAGHGNNYLDGRTGQDTLSYANAEAPVKVSLASTAAQATGGSGTDTVLNFENLTGSAFADTLTGNSAANIIDGGLGADKMSGGSGNDTYVVDDAGDTIADSGGTDTVKASLPWTLGTNLENLVLLGATSIDGIGNALNNALTGNSATNLLSGLQGNDTLDGGGGLDTLIGGVGNDTYLVDTDTDIIIENAGEGTDKVISSVSYVLGTNIEKLTLTGSAETATGNSLSNTLTGNDAGNTLSGLDGNDTLDGGNGTDTLIGGKGNDTYVVDNPYDVIDENPGEGTDTVKSSVTLTLGSGSNLENLTLTGSTAINGTGNELNNVLTGNAADNVLVGNGGNDALNGGGGVDTLIGGAGNDSYVVDTTTDIIIENVGEGTDTVKSSTTYALSLESSIENLTLTGSSAIDGTGNGLNNVLTGNSGNNRLDGAAGSDVLVGGTGSDVLVGGSGADRFDFNALGESRPGLADVIFDFSRAELDKIDLSTLDANAIMLKNQAFEFVGEEVFSSAGQLRFADGIIEGGLVVQGDVNGDGLADLEITVMGVSSLAEYDFIL